MSRTNAIICSLDEDVLIGIVMKLTGGAASPSVVKAQIARVRKEHDVEHSRCAQVRNLGIEIDQQ